MSTFSHIPPGFRFHPTEEELVDYYLRKKVTSRKIDWDVIREVDLYKIEPWDLQERCGMNGVEEETEWYFFSHKDRKYPTGTRTNRATTVGFWKATGRDKPIYSRQALVGMRKTLVYYKGRAPNGQKSDWIMHEYRLETNVNGAVQEEGWVVCRVFKKREATVQRDHGCWTSADHLPFFPDPESPNYWPTSHADFAYQQHPYPFRQEMVLNNNLPINQHFLQLPQLESPKLLDYINQGNANISSPLPLNDPVNSSVDRVTDWRVLDRFVAAQLSQDDALKETSLTDAANDHENIPDEPGTAMPPDLASSSACSSQIDPLK